MDDVTAEPRMEDLLASIRKAINEDIGDGPVPAGAAAREKPDAPAARAEPRIIPPKQGEEPATAAEIQQLREKITRSRAGDAVAPRDPVQRAASLAAALRSDTPRRSWREIESAAPPPPSPPPRLRSTILEPEAPRAPAPARAQMAPRPVPPRPSYEVPRPPAERPPLTAPTRADSGAMLSGGTAEAVQTAFSRLADTAAVRARGERSIEDMTKDMLRGMLKQWLDENLPQLVERLVREEIERVARTGR